MLARLLITCIFVISVTVTYRCHCGRPPVRGLCRLRSAQDFGGTLDGLYVSQEPISADERGL
jgi:hypothetical protein